MAKKKDYNAVEINGKKYTVVDCAREETEVREIPYTISEYIKEVENGEICRDPLIERTDDQWVRKQKSKLVEAVLHHRPIGNIALAKGRAESKNYAVTSLLDGLQRTTALVDFKNDRFAIDKRVKPVKCKVIDENGNETEEMCEIAGKKYSQLPDAIKKLFDKYRLTTFLHMGFTDEELDDIVFCMNNGKTPNSYQKIRFLLGSDIMRLLQPICDSTLWDDSKGCKAKNDSILCCVVRILMMMTHYSYKSLGSAAMTKFADIDFDDYVTTGVISRLAELVKELAKIKFELNDFEIEKFDSLTIPHYIMNLDKYHQMNNPDGIEYIDVLHAFWDSEDYHSFVADSSSDGSGSSLYSAESIEDRQYDIDDFLDGYLDTAEVKTENKTENDNGDDENEYAESGQIANTDEEAGTEVGDTGDRETEINFSETALDVGTLPTDSRCCQQTSCVGQQGEEGANDLSGREQTPESA